MKNLILIIVLLSSYTFSSAKALAPIENSSLYEHMVEVNAQWEKFKTACPNKVLSFNSEEERIQMHLSLVVKHLSNYVNPELSAKQLKNRSLLLNALSVYADYGQFPLNAYHSVRTPYFIDDYGTHCAVGYLMAFSGNESLSIQISDNQNFHYLIDIEHPDLLNWSKEFGFTLDELKWIQPSYNPTESFEQVGFGTNGEIIDFYPYYRGYVIGGNFDTLNAIPCLNIGNFENNQLSCIGEGVNGNIAAVSELQGNYYACGELLEDGKI